MNTVRVNRKAAERAASGHPWLFLSDITSVEKAQPGEAVKVLDHRGKLIGTAHYSSTSQIALRLLSPKAEAIDRAFLIERLAAALKHRELCVQNSDAYRLVFSEADLLPGLIADRYDDYVVMQTLSQGMDRARDVIADCLVELLQPKGILARNDATVRTKEGLPLEVVTLAGEIPPRVNIHMNGLQLSADLLHGQKTGVYLDQRENYVAAARWAARLNKPRVLDCFTSTGGFALHLAPHAEIVDAIDSSMAALATAEANAITNRITNVQFRQADAFDYLAGLSDARRYHLIVLDPPAFAKSRKQIDDAARGYKEINRQALRLLDSGGILITCSCSHHMIEGAFFEAIAEAALDAGKTLRVLERRTQASDHPILLTVPETLYLKCLVLQVV